ncbi:hypothetical protein [Pelomonas sp. Root1444]|uniref:hypothetical protein n=1 Tax=Pelomonas sp. Root1444 TaxID=1736464 RepID=UPI00070381A9|nr:hypothetical protein [Pelomonas sp. Root1444]KQY80915.1 hypothetical protein ASD35_03450 [Pelomonas sp. Root1444]
MSPEPIVLEAPAELRLALEPLLPTLVGQGVERLVVFSYCRPGEPKFWLAYLFVDGKRHSLGTPDLLTLPLDAQVLDLVRQLETFRVPPTSLAAELLGTFIPANNTD